MKHSKFKVDSKKKFKFADYPKPDFTADFKSEKNAEKSLEKDAEEMLKYQDMLMKHEKYGLLVIFQGMDAAGKDPIIRHIMSNVDPQGCETKLFKPPTEKERRHDYLWRVFAALPARGQIGIFNRSYYEHLVAERIYPENLEKWTLPDECKGRGMWNRLYKEVRNFEEYLFDNGIHVLKFFLNMSKKKQRERLLERIAKREKRSDFTMSDLEDREKWDEFMNLYERAIDETSTEKAPWYVLPDDHRWFAKAAASSIIVDKLKSFHDDFPEIDDEQKQILRKGKEKLENESRSADGASARE